MLDHSKTCITCKKEKTLDNFYIRSDTGKHRNQCKSCLQEGYAAKWKEDEEYRKAGKTENISKRENRKLHKVVKLFSNND